MYKNIFLSLFLLITFSSFSQKVYDVDKNGNVSNMNKKLIFYNSCIIDYDFERLSNCSEMLQEVLIIVDSVGKGNIHIYLDKKNTFKINRSYISNGFLAFEIKGEGNKTIDIWLVNDKNGYVQKLYIKDNSNNSGLLLYNY